MIPSLGAHETEIFGRGRAEATEFVKVSNENEAKDREFSKTVVRTRRDQ